MSVNYCHVSLSVPLQEKCPGLMQGLTCKEDVIIKTVNIHIVYIKQTQIGLNVAWLLHGRSPTQRVSIKHEIST